MNEFLNGGWFLGGLVLLGIAFLLFRKLNMMFESDIRKIMLDIVIAQLAAHNTDEEAHKLTIRKDLAEINSKLADIQSKLISLPCRHSPIEYCPQCGHGPGTTEEVK